MPIFVAPPCCSADGGARSPDSHFARAWSHMLEQVFVSDGRLMHAAKTCVSAPVLLICTRLLTSDD